MRVWKLALAATAASLALGGTAMAQDDASPSFSFNVGGANDYVFRGVSQTDQDPQIFAGADVTSGSLYAGVWASNVDFLDSTDAEVDIYAGFKPTVGAANLDLGVIYYGYVDAPSGADYAYWEVKAAGSVPVGPASVGAAAYYSPDFFGAVDEALYYEVNGSLPLGASGVSVTGAVGRQEMDGPGDYTTWNLGAGYAINDHIGVDVRYWDTDGADEFGKYYDSRFVAGVKAAF
jgi:uncharacterized protein (TIGR02001 family)